MKVRINISIDEEAVSILNLQANKSQFIEDLILLGSPRAETSTGLSEQRVREIIKEELSTPKNIDLASLGIKTADTFTPKPPDPDKGYPCCSGRTPCKHWLWDDMNTEWKNSITGKTREA